MQSSAIRSDIAKRRARAGGRAVTIEDEERSISDTAVHMTPQERRADGLTIRFAENGAGGVETILLLSPWPESLFAWNTIWPRHADAAQLVAIDLPGFGQSERCADLISRRAMGGSFAGSLRSGDLATRTLSGPTSERPPCCSRRRRTMNCLPAPL